jgi:hypothetical protein
MPYRRKHHYYNKHPKAVWRSTRPQDQQSNMTKSSVSPIQCSAAITAELQEHLACRVEHFPVKYMGLLLSLKKLTKTQLQPIIDHMADLPTWKADLMTKAGHAIQVQFVLTATIIYQAMALDLPQWMFKAIDKIRRGYMWRGRKEAKGGHCLLAWPKVTQPMNLGGLGISDLKFLSIPLRVRWLWLQRSQPDKPWASLPIEMTTFVEAFFSMVIYTEIGD